MLPMAWKHEMSNTRSIMFNNATIVATPFKKKEEGQLVRNCTIFITEDTTDFISADWGGGRMVIVAYNDVAPS